MPRHWVIAIVVVVAVGAGVTAFALASDDDSSPVVTTTSVLTTTTVAVTTTAVPDASTTSDPPETSSTTELVCDAPDGEVEPVDGGIGVDTFLLTEVVASAQGSCDEEVRFVFEPSTGSAPGFRVGYEAPPFFEDGSGAPVEVLGDAFLVVRFEPATTFDFIAGELAYTGPESILGGDRFVREVRLTGAFEGLVTWIIGLDSEMPFRVEATANSLALKFGPGSDA